MTDAATSDQHPRQASWPWLALVLFVAGVGLYVLARYHGQWAEADSAAFTRYIRGVADSGRVIPDGEIYPNGYVDQVVSATVMAFTGLPAGTLQQLVYPLLAGIVVAPAWMAYRVIGGTTLAAAISTVLLVTLPEFLFVIIRSSHEKFSRTMMLICLFLLVLPVVRRLSRARSGLVGALFLLAAYTLMATNLPLASSFILAIATAAVVGTVLARVRPNLRPATRRFTIPAAWLVVGSVCVGYVLAAWVYPPVVHNVRVLENTADQIVEFLSGTSGEAGDVLAAYTYINTGWIDPRVYLVLSAGNWVLLGGSLVIWSHQGWRWLIRRDERVVDAAWVLWLLYTAFLLQAALAIVSDATGAFGRNLQLRLFPSFAVIAAAMLGTAIATRMAQPSFRVVRPAVAAGVVALSVLSVVKVTNEPLLSNKWNFYRPSEVVALRWQDEHLVDADVWTEFDERLLVALHTEHPVLNNRFGSAVSSTTRDMAVSDVTRLRAARIGQPLPVPPDAWEVYDNGLTQLYHLRPESPYQP